MEIQGGQEVLEDKKQFKCHKINNYFLNERSI